MCMYLYTMCADTQDDDRSIQTGIVGCCGLTWSSAKVASAFNWCATSPVPDKTF